MTAPLPTDADAALFGNRFVTQEVPSPSSRKGGWRRRMRCGWSSRTWRSRAILPGIWPPS